MNTCDNKFNDVPIVYSTIDTYLKYVKRCLGFTYELSNEIKFDSGLEDF
jgi:hypothetical protein